MKYAKYAEIKLNVGVTYIQPFDQLDVLIDEIKEGEPGHEWTIRIVEMTEEEHQALPDFDGH